MNKLQKIIDYAKEIQAIVNEPATDYNMPKQEIFTAKEMENVRRTIIAIRALAEQELNNNITDITNPESKELNVGESYEICLKQSEAGYMTKPYVGDAIFLGDSTEKDCGRFKVEGWDECLFPYYSVMGNL